MICYVSIILEPGGLVTTKKHYNWLYCEEDIRGKPTAFAKKFPSEEDADKFVDSLSSKWKDWQRVIRENSIPTAYVDGSCKLKPELISGWGLAVYDEAGQSLHEDYGVVGKGESHIELEDHQYIKSRQIVGELYSAYKALEWSIKNKTPIILAFDYIGIIHYAFSIWECRTPIQQWYAEKMKPHEQYVKSWQWTPGHTGIKGNEHADKLAAQAVKEYWEL
jgi:ribonuclease H-related protein